MLVRLLPKQETRVRFSYPAPNSNKKHFQKNFLTRLSENSKNDSFCHFDRREKSLILAINATKGFLSYARNDNSRTVP